VTATAQLNQPITKQWWVQQARFELATRAHTRGDINVMQAHELVAQGILPPPLQRNWFTAAMRAPYFRKQGTFVRDVQDKPVSMFTRTYKLDWNTFYRVMAQGAPTGQAAKPWFSTSVW
jgi:hypothetical protein